MKKAEIIAQTIDDVRYASIDAEVNIGSDPGEEQILIEVLETLLRDIEPDHNIQTCHEFGHLKSECCEICHAHYPHYEMSLLDVEGDKAWICCALERELFPQKHSQFKSSSAYKTLAMILSMENKD